MEIQENIPLLEEILGKWKDQTASDHLGYKNHVYRMINFCFALHDFNEEEREKVVIAGCFHDLGIWSGKTFDYLPPSIKIAKEYLKQNDLEKWTAGIELMIDQHHKLRKYNDDPLVEVFRQGDLVDFSLGIFKCGLPGSYVREVKAAFPNAGFHKRLVKLAGSWICRHPLHPVPVVKW